jgi:hypothetical protein
MMNVQETRRTELSRLYSVPFASSGVGGPLIQHYKSTIFIFFFPAQCSVTQINFISQTADFKFKLRTSPVLLSFIVEINTPPSLKSVSLFPWTVSVFLFLPYSIFIKGPPSQNMMKIGVINRIIIINSPLKNFYYENAY